MRSAMEVAFRSSQILLSASPHAPCASQAQKDTQASGAALAASIHFMQSARGLGSQRAVVALTAVVSLSALASSVCSAFCRMRG